MFNPHIHQQQQQQQQQQFQQHLRQLQQLFQQPPPPPPPPPPPGHHVAHHHHQTPRAISVAPQTAPPPRMVNLCQATQTTILAPNPMLQGALLMQQMQGNMRGFGMGGQQFRQFFTAGARSSLLGPVPMGMALKSPIMGFPAARPFHPHARFYNNNSNTITTTAPSAVPPSSSSITTDTIARQPDRKQDGEQMAAGSTEAQPSAGSSSDAHDKSEADGEVDGGAQTLDEELEEPAAKKLKTEPETITTADAEVEVLSSENNTENQDEDCSILEGGSTGESVEMTEDSRADELQTCLSATSPSVGLNEDEQRVHLTSEEMTLAKDESSGSPGNPDEGEEGVADRQFYCYLCSITCHNQQNFRSHMNSVSHQQRMMEIQHMSNACLVTLLPRVQESLQGAVKDGENKADLKRWCATCHTHFTGSITDHHRTEEHKLASRTALSSCVVCKKHFKTAQVFVEHLQSQEHKQEMEKLQEKEGCEALAKLTAMDTDGFSLEEEDSELKEDEEEDQGCSEKLEGWSSLKEVTLKNMASDEQYDPDTVYGSGFFVPVAGFICRLCNKFYRFESSALHTHCKSLTHFENLKRSRSLLSQKDEAVRERLLAADGLRPVAENTTDLSEENSLSDDAGSVTNSTQPKITLTQTEPQQHVGVTTSETCAGSTDRDLTLHSREDETTTQAPVLQDSPAELSAESKEEPDSMQVAGAVDVKEEPLETEAPAVPGKKIGTAKARTAAKRRSGRAASRR